MRTQAQRHQRNRLPVFLGPVALPACLPPTATTCTKEEAGGVGTGDRKLTAIPVACCVHGWTPPASASEALLYVSPGATEAF